VVIVVYPLMVYVVIQTATASPQYNARRIRLVHVRPIFLQETVLNTVVTTILMLVASHYSTKAVMIVTMDTSFVQTNVSLKIKNVAILQMMTVL